MDYIFPLFYFPKISWWRQLVNCGLIHRQLNQLNSETTLILISTQYEQKNHHNRCQIKGPNRIQYLTVPIYKHSKKLSIDKAVIANEENWRLKHIKSIQSSYGKTAFFEYYSTEIFEIIKKRYDSLYELNLDCIYLIAKFLGLDISNECVNMPSNLPSDYLTIRNYYQPFGIFSPDLSILDLIFNMGPESILFLSDNE